MKTAISLLIISLITIVVLSCGDDPSGPSGSNLTPSVLSLAFTGDSSKTVSEADQIEALRFSTTGPKGVCEVTASWTICDQSEFASYTLYRSENPDISENISSATVLGVFSDPNTSEYIDGDVAWAIEYYYALKTTDDDNDSVWSNEASLITPGAPTPSVLEAVSVFCNFVALSWSQCPDGNFDSYKLFRSDFPNIHADTSAALCVATLSQASDTSFTDTGVATEQTYYYALMTRNTNDFFSWSNELEVIIPEYPEIPDSVVATVSVGNSPYCICSLPSGEYVYVSNWQDDNISVIRTSDNIVAATVGVGSNPYGICSLPSGEYVYVCNYFDDNISVIRTSDNTVVTTIGVGDNPRYICSLPSGEYVYVTNDDYEASILVIQTSDNTVVDTLSVVDIPKSICSLPSGEYVYVSVNNGISIIQTSDNNVVATVDLDYTPDGICSLPSGEYLYLANKGYDNVSVIQTSDNTVIATVSVGDGPRDICSLPSGEYVYVTNKHSNNISVIQTSNNTVYATVDVGYSPYGICFLPSGEYVYVNNTTSANVSVLH